MGWIDAELASDLTVCCDAPVSTTLSFSVLACVPGDRPLRRRVVLPRGPYGNARAGSSLAWCSGDKTPRPRRTRQTLVPVSDIIAAVLLGFFTAVLRRPL